MSSNRANKWTDGGTYGKLKERVRGRESNVWRGDEKRGYYTLKKIIFLYDAGGFAEGRDAGICIQEMSNKMYKYIRNLTGEGE